MPYSYDRRVAKKVPLSERSPLERAVYYVGTALNELKAGSPAAAQDSLAKALQIADPTVQSLKSDLTKAMRFLSGSSPREADSILEKVYKSLKSRS